MTRSPDTVLARLRSVLVPVDEVPVIEQPRQAAVAAVVRGEGGGDGDELELLLIRRAERVGDVWSGHVALPGGRRELADADLVATAVRETMEEVAVDLAAPGAVLLGALPALLPRNPQLPPIAVQPYVWHVTGECSPATSDEVAAVGWLSIRHLRDAERVIEHRLVTPDGVARVFPAIDVGGAVPLWGMTHRIVGTLLDALDRA